MASERDPKKESDNGKGKENTSRSGSAGAGEKDGDKKKGKENISQSESGGAGDIVADFIEDVWQVMTPEMLERLRCVLTEDMGLSKKDADNFIQSQREIRKQRICLKKDRRIIRIGPRNQWIKELSRDIGSQIASFLVGLLLSNRTHRTKKITEKILERLCELTGEKTTIKSAKTRIQRTLVVIADRMATYFDEAITDFEKEMREVYGSATSIEAWSRDSVTTLASTETYTLSERDEYDLNQMSESELEKLLASEGKRKVSIKEEGEIISDEEEEESETKEVSATKEGSEEVESTEEESGVSVEEEAEEDLDEEMGEEEEEKDELSEAEEEEEMEEEEKIEEEEEEEEEEGGGEEEEEEEEESESVEEEEDSEVGGNENEEGEGEEDEGIEEPQEEEDEEIQDGIKKTPISHLDILELLKEDIERTPRGDDKTDRQMAVKEIIEKRFEEIAKDKLNTSLDSIVKFDINETASIVANWLEKILPSGDIVAKLSLVPSLIKKQGSAFEITEGEGSQYQVHKLSSTTVAQKVAEAKGVDFPIRKKKLPRSMSPLNAKTTKDWADWALEAANVGEEWGKWLDKTLDSVEEHLLKDKDTDSSQVKRHDDWKNQKDILEHEAQKWRAEKRKIKGEAYLWNKKIGSEKPVGPEKETKVVNY